MLLTEVSLTARRNSSPVFTVTVAPTVLLDSAACVVADVAADTVAGSAIAVDVNPTPQSSIAGAKMATMGRRIIRGLSFKQGCLRSRQRNHSLLSHPTGDFS